MDHAAFHIIYVDKRVSAALDGKYLREIAPDLLAGQELALPTDKADQQPNCFQQISSEIAVVRHNLTYLLSSFQEGMLNRREPLEFLHHIFYGVTCIPSVPN